MVDLSQEQGRLELLRGNDAQAFVYLSDAYAQRPKDEALRFLVAMARRSIIMTIAPARKTRDSAMAEALDLGFGYNLYSIALSADGSRMVTASRDAVSVWDVVNGTQVRSFGPEQPADNFDNGATFATFIDKDRQVLSRDGRTVKVWNADTGELARTLPELGAEAAAAGSSGEDVELSPDQKQLLVPRGAAEVYDGRRVPETEREGA